jgi:hypothetical protein
LQFYQPFSLFFVVFCYFFGYKKPVTLKLVDYSDAANATKYDKKKEGRREH